MSDKLERKIEKYNRKIEKYKGKIFKNIKTQCTEKFDNDHKNEIVNMNPWLQEHLVKPIPSRWEGCVR